jgi:hypothetical protein
MTHKSEISNFLLQTIKVQIFHIFNETMNVKRKQQQKNKIKYILHPL